MEESKELEGLYKILGRVVYVWVVVELFEYGIEGGMVEEWGGIVREIEGGMKEWMI